MSKALSSYPEAQRMAIAIRRTKTLTKSNGYWAAVDFLAKVMK